MELSLLSFSYKTLSSTFPRYIHIIRFITTVLSKCHPSNPRRLYNKKGFFFLLAQTLFVNMVWTGLNIEPACVKSVSLANSKIHQSERYKVHILVFSLFWIVGFGSPQQTLLYCHLKLSSEERNSGSGTDFGPSFVPPLPSSF
jgi:hypothetical protein